MGIGDLGVSRPIDHVKGIDGSAGLGADARKGDGNAFAIQAGENVVKQAESISGLDLDQRLSRMCSVIDGNASWKFDFMRGPAATLVPCFFQ